MVWGYLIPVITEVDCETSDKSYAKVNR